MNNALGAQDIPLTVFGGAVSEMSPEDLPEGASPLNQDVDFVPGAVFTRGGRKNQYYYENLSLRQLCRSALSLAGSFAPNEQPWSNPSNATLGSPGTYASVTLNTPSVVTPGIGAFEGSTTGVDTNPSGSTAITTALFNPTSKNSFFYGLVQTVQQFISNPVSVTPPWNDDNFFPLGNAAQITAVLNSQTPLGIQASIGTPDHWCALEAIFGLAGTSAPTIVQRVSGASGHTSVTLPNPVGAGNTVLMFYMNPVQNGNSVSFGDDKGNIYKTIDASFPGTSPNGCEAVLGYCQNITNSPQTMSYAAADTANKILCITEYQGGVFGPTSPSHSQILQALNFGLAIPSTTGVLGFEIEIDGKQDNTDPASVLSVTLAHPGLNGAPTFTVQLPSSDGTVVAGSPLESWGLVLTPAILNDPNFAVNITASANVSAGFNISGVRILPFLSPNPPSNFNWLQTYKQDDGNVDTLLLDSSGVLWDENVTSSPGILNAIFMAIEPNTFAKGVTFLDVEWMALSNLTNGTDMPRQWDGTNLDRVSQVGPGAPPSCSGTGSTINIVSITQPTAKSDPLAPGQLSGILWSAGPGNSGAGNVITVYYATVASEAQDMDITVGGGIVLAGVDVAGPNNNFNGHAVNGEYTVTSIGSGVPPGAQFSRWFFTVQATVSQFVNQANHVSGHGPFGTYQVTEATMTTASQVPNLEVGNQFTIAGTGGAPTAGYDGTWTVDQTPNASQLQIVSVARSANIATYGFNLISGTTPVVGQLVTIVGTLADNQSFNVSNQAIASVSPGAFTLAQPGNNVSSTGESGSGTISGTIFKFDPAAIVGTKTGVGTVATTGVIGQGLRRAVCIFQTRSAALTQPSPYVEFTVTGSTSSLNVSNIPIGPPDTIRRIIAFTGAGGGNYFYIPQPVTVTDNGQQVTYTATVVPDNTTVSANFSFPDAILLAGIAIDVQGNNLFAQRELGSCLGFLSYSDRLFAWGEQNKVQNFLNLSFDGGYLPPLSTAVPLGWTPDVTSGAGGSLLVSPLFGNSFYIQNLTGSTQALYGMISQGAYANQLGTPIINSSTEYSVRITARCPSGVTTGNLVVDLFSPQLAQIFGSFTVPLASMTTTMQIFTGALLTKAQEFGTVPKDLRLRVYASALPNNGDVEIDRLEPFPTLEPVFATSFTASYALNPQGFDSITGQSGPNQNQQAIRGGAEMFDLLFALKERSIYSTSDNGVTEPSFWNWREVSQEVGTVGIHSYDYGEDWLVTACRPGIYFFNGGSPIKVSQEIQPVWDAINWSAAATIWLRNDVINKRITVGIPLPTGPGTKSFPYLPEMPANANPMTPNVVLAMSYRELNSGFAFAETGPIRSSYTGRLLSPEPARKTSWWNISSPYADFVDRANNETPLFLCTGYHDSKVFTIDPDTFSDDELPINSFYFTYGFTKAEMQDAKGLGLHRMLLQYLTALTVGNGDMNVWVYPESPQNDEPIVLDPIANDAITQGDVESDANIPGNRFFVRYGTNQVGSWFRLSKVVATLSPDPWSSIRGTATGG